MNYTAEITKAETGEMRVYVGEWPRPLDHAEVGTLVYMWSSGNYGCDCNREAFWCRAAAEPEPDDEEPCTEGRFTVRLLGPDGAELWTDAPAEPLAKPGDCPGCSMALRPEELAAGTCSTCAARAASRARAAVEFRVDLTARVAVLEAARDREVSR